MKVVKTPGIVLGTIQYIEPGNAFIHSDEIYIKCMPFTGRHDRAVAAEDNPYALGVNGECSGVRLSDGQVVIFPNETTVLTVTAKVVQEL